MPSKEQLDLALARYPAALALRAAASKSSTDIVALDRWYRGELRTAVHDRIERDDEPEQRLTLDELKRVMDWKLARGKFRPRLQAMIASNPPSTLASALSRHSSATSPRARLEALCTLKAVGPATASALLALFKPAQEPFMSDEAMEFVNSRSAGAGGGAGGKKEYTVKAWEAYRADMLQRKDDERWESVEELEMALWSWGVLCKYGGEEEKEGLLGDVKKGAQEDAPRRSKKRSSKTVAALEDTPSLPTATKKRKSR
ncbi:hypothetical protein Rhopal_002985-T1 [Rhodotorula paludigena]|uniref:HhH-GPD domain-containing protein n=1 Tax=Rhodotorula paludigena TaxID=86838 RepID=A0AAV5GKH0_9BASI|nr:hypothetical protein Rhopal_002985-T1 [Rhodotorula paludigena]